MYQIDIEDLRYSYPTSKGDVLKGINLKVKEGEFLSIMGPTGTGKSTLCLTLNGIIPHSLEGDLRGKVKVAGMDIKNHSVPELTQKVGMVFQEPESQLFCMTVWEEVAFGPENLGVDPKEIKERVDWALGVVRMKEYQDRSPFKLSCGQKQRVAIAAALAMLPEILVLDEPTSELDPIGKMEVFSVVDDLKKEQNMAIVMVEHESEEIARVSDRVVVLKEGKIILEGSPRDVLNKVDMLKNARLSPPQVCEVADILNKKINTSFSFLTLKEAEKSIKELVSKLPKAEKSSKSKEKKTSFSYIKQKSFPHSMISTKNLFYAYEGSGVEVLKDINLEVNQGEFVAIIGQNGAGKTTLVKHFNGILKPTRGKVFIEGVNTKERTIAELSKDVGYIYQNPDHQIFCPTVEEEIAFGPKNLGLSEDIIKQRAEEALKLSGLEEVRKTPPSVLGLGERRKVSLASVMSMRPRLLILDEPTTGVDWKTSIDFMEAVRKLNEKGHTIIMITHNMRIVARYAKRTVVLCNGEVLLDASTRKVFSQTEKLKTTFLMPPQITQLGQALYTLGMPREILSCEEFCDNLFRL